MRLTNFFGSIILSVLASSALAAPTPAPPSPPATAPRFLKPITIGGVTYGLVRETPGQVIGTSTWTLTDESPGFIVKQFRTNHPDKAIADDQKTAFDSQSSHVSLLLARHPTIARSASLNLQFSGVSTLKIDGRDEQSSWMLLPTLNGKGFRSQPGWTQIYNAGCKRCIAFLKDARKELVAHATELHKTTGLVHLRSDEHNTMWNRDANKIEGFIGYEHLFKSDSPEYRRAVDEVWSGHSRQSVDVTLPYYVEKVAIRYYPDEWCPTASTQTLNRSRKKQKTGP